MLTWPAWKMLTPETTQRRGRSAGWKALGGLGPVGGGSTPENMIHVQVSADGNSSA
eukprot:m.291712 g.291712  ORF g.291712 m.291712 type:complete len:56 (+) comp19984_c0_seq2:1013-1180(+)